jgi:formylglycine-generating enzyme
MSDHIQTFRNNPFTFTMKHVEGGTFDMGSNDAEAFVDEKPIHAVTVKTFRIGKFPVTQALWKAIMDDNNPSSFKGDNRPVELVSWKTIKEDFLPRLNEMTNGLRSEGSEYRLPSEAEWEYAAKGGIYHKDFLFLYSGSNKLDDVGWYDDNGHRETKPVGMKSPNLLGIYDMSGNVFEWCEDDWHKDYKGAPTDGSAWIDKETSTHRVQRGGSWNKDPRLCRVTYRNFIAPSNAGHNIGFRLVLDFPFSSQDVDDIH